MDTDGERGLEGSHDRLYPPKRRRTEEPSSSSLNDFEEKPELNRSQTPSLQELINAWGNGEDENEEEGGGEGEEELEKTKELILDDLTQELRASPEREEQMTQEDEDEEEEEKLGGWSSALLSREIRQSSFCVRAGASYTPQLLLSSSQRRPSPSSSSSSSSSSLSSTFRSFSAPTTPNRRRRVKEAEGNKNKKNGEGGGGGREAEAEAEAEGSAVRILGRARSMDGVQKKRREEGDGDGDREGGGGSEGGGGKEEEEEERERKEGGGSVVIKMMPAVRAAVDRKNFRILLVRHGQSVANVCKALLTVTSDHTIPLSPNGEKQALEAGKRIAQFYQDHPRSSKRRLWVSPYKRTRQTAEAIATAAGDFIDDCKENILLGEQQFGLFEGLPTEDILKFYPREYDHFTKAIKYGGRFWARMPLGESRFDVAARVKSMFDELLSDQLRDSVEDIVIVSHGTTLRALAMMWLERTPEWFENEKNPGNCSIRLIEGMEDKGYIFEGFAEEEGRREGNNTKRKPEHQTTEDSKKPRGETPSSPSPSPSSIPSLHSKSRSSPSPSPPSLGQQSIEEMAKKIDDLERRLSSAERIITAFEGLVDKILTNPSPSTSSSSSSLTSPKT